MKIVLLGYMGSGKTTVGKLLAQQMNLNFIDLDNYIEKSLDTTIPELFGSKGEIFFRLRENELLKEVMEEQENVVLALGGGTPCYSNNMDLVLNYTSNVFYIKLSIPELSARLAQEKENRPLISHLSEEELPEFIGKHLFERNPFYNQATHVIMADKLKVEDLSDQIQGKLV